VAIAFRGVSTANITAADPLAAVGLPASTASGDMVLLLLGYKYGDATTIAAQPTSWQDPTENEVQGGTGAAGIDAGITRTALWAREYDGVWTMPTVDLSGVPNSPTLTAISYSKGAGEVWDPVVCVSAVDTTAAAAAYDPAISGSSLALAPADMLAALDVVNGDVGTQTLPGTLTVAGITFGTGVNRINQTTPTGQDSRLMLTEFPVSSGTATAGVDRAVTFTSGGAGLAGGSVFARLRVTTPPAAVLPSLVMAPRT
jgi:hypothetical protein